MHLVFIDNFIKNPANYAINRLSQELSFSHEYYMPAYFSSNMPQLDRSSKQIDAVIVLGSGSHVYHNEDWHQQVFDYAFECANKGIAVLGICFGHQLIHSRLGGTISYIDDKQMLQQLREIRVQSPLISHKKLKLAYSHQQYVSESSPQMEVIGSSELFQNEITVHKSLPIWTTQSHPEASEVFYEKELGMSHDQYLELHQDGISFIHSFLSFAKNG